MDSYFQEELIKKKEEIDNLSKEMKSLLNLLEEEVEKLEEMIEEVELENDILNIPKFKGQVVFERYLQAIEEKRKRQKGKIKEKQKIRGAIERNEIIRAQKDIEKIKQMMKDK